MNCEFISKILKEGRQITVWRLCGGTRSKPLATSCLPIVRTAGYAWTVFRDLICLFGRFDDRSCIDCKFSQNSGEVSNASDSSQAVSGETPLFPLTISLTRWIGMSRWSANSFWVSPIGSRYSLSSMVPGCVVTLFFGIMMFHPCYLLMIIDNGNVMSTGILPPKYNSPLGINSNTMKTFVITPQCFQPVAGWWSQIIKRSGGIQNIKFIRGGFKNLGRKFSDLAACNAMKQVWRCFISKWFDHSLI